jgi:hypothetical protein
MPNAILIAREDFSYAAIQRYTNFALPGVPEGRHNVAHSGSCGKMSEAHPKTPTGVTQGIQPHQISPHPRLKPNAK